MNLIVCSGRQTVGLQGLVIKLADWLRMDTQGGLKWIAVVFTIVAGIDFPVVSRQFIIHSDSDISGNT